jgi:uncharacterized MAPEG superfamily protein
MLLDYLVYSALLTAALFIPAGLARAFSAESIWKGLWWEVGNREGAAAPTSPFCGRALRAFNNSVESFATFAAVALVAHATGHNPHLADTLAQTFFFARLSFAGLYWLGVPVLRTVAFYTGFGATVGLGLLDLGLIG